MKPVWEQFQFGFQRRHATGRILNIGCSCDGGLLAELGALNMDLQAVNPATKIPNAAHVLADCLALPFRPIFDTVVLGDILEHFDDTTIRKALEQAAGVLASNGKVVITCPDDCRSLIEQERAAGVPAATYGADVSTYHTRRMPLSQLKRLLWAADFEVETAEPIEYTHDVTGWGVVARLLA